MNRARPIEPSHPTADAYAKANPLSWFEVGDPGKKAEAQARLDADDYPADDEHAIPCKVIEERYSHWWLRGQERGA